MYAIIQKGGTVFNFLNFTLSSSFVESQMNY